MNDKTATKPTIDVDSLKAYRARWEAVAQFELEEQRQKSVAQRLHLLNALFQFAITTGMYAKAMTQKTQDAEPARQRWIKLKSKLT